LSTAFDIVFPSEIAILLFAILSQSFLFKIHSESISDSFNNQDIP
jgi:hypothetical protein